VARWFDPSLGRFTSPDTIVPTSTQGTQAWDRYAFVNNNPVRYNDPTGHMCSDPEDPTPTCEGSAHVQTKVGDTMVNGDGKQLGTGDRREEDGGIDVSSVDNDTDTVDNNNDKSNGKCHGNCALATNSACAPGSLDCVLLSGEELAHLYNFLLFAGSLEIGLLGLATVATLPTGLALVFVIAYVGSDFESMISAIDDAATGDASVRLEVSRGFLGDAYHFDGAYMEQYITAPGARQTISMAVSYYQIKHLLFGNP
jgi:hypothetical protein